MAPAQHPLVTSTACGIAGIGLTLHGARAGTLVGMVEIGVGALLCLLALNLGSSKVSHESPVHGDKCATPAVDGS